MTTAHRGPQFLALMARIRGNGGPHAMADGKWIEGIRLPGIPIEQSLEAFVARVFPAPPSNDS